MTLNKKTASKIRISYLKTDTKFLYFNNNDILLIYIFFKYNVTKFFLELS